jgi:hypothetical protein
MKILPVIPQATPAVAKPSIYDISDWSQVDDNEDYDYK